MTRSSIVDKIFGLVYMFVGYVIGYELGRKDKPPLDILMEDIGNIDEDPPRPIVAKYPVPALVSEQVCKDIIFTFCADNDMVLVPKSIIQTIDDVAKNVPDFYIRTMGAMETANDLVIKNEYFKQVLNESRKNGLHY